MTTINFQSLPPKTLLALDLISLTSSPAFRGIRNVPPGLHFIFTGADAGLSIRHGLWFLVPESGHQDITFRWYGEEERLLQVHEENSVIPTSGAGIGLRDQLGGGLVDYQLQQASGEQEDDLLSWHNLTNYVIADHLSRVLGNPDSLTSPSWAITSVSTSPQDVEAEIPGIDPLAFSTNTSNLKGEGVPAAESSNLRLVPIDLKRTWRPGAIGRERTEAAQDRSWALGDLLDRAITGNASSPDVDMDANNSAEDITKSRELGAKYLFSELQFTFVCALLLGNYSCLEQWKRIINLLFTSRRAIAEIPGFFVLVLRLLQPQIRCLGEGAMFEAGGIVEEIREEFNGGGLVGGIGRMGKEVESWRKSVDEVLPKEVEGSSELRVEIKKLWAVLREELGWESEDNGTSVLKRGMVQLEDGEEVELEMEGADEEDELGEYAPVVVDLD